MTRMARARAASRAQAGSRASFGLGRWPSGTTPHPRARAAQPGDDGRRGPIERWMSKHDDRCGITPHRGVAAGPAGPGIKEEEQHAATARMAADTRPGGGGRPRDRGVQPGRQHGTEPRSAAPSASAAASGSPAASGSAAASPSAAANACGDAPGHAEHLGRLPGDRRGLQEGRRGVQDDCTRTSTSRSSAPTSAASSRSSRRRCRRRPRVTSSSGRRTSCPGSSTRACSLPLPDDLLTYVKSGAVGPSTVSDATYNGRDRAACRCSTAAPRSTTTRTCSPRPGSRPRRRRWTSCGPTRTSWPSSTPSGNVTRSGLSLRLSGQGSGVAEKFWILLLQYGKSLICRDRRLRQVGRRLQRARGRQAPPDATSTRSRTRSTRQNIEHDAKAFETKADRDVRCASRGSSPTSPTNAPDLVGHYGTISLPVGRLRTAPSTCSSRRPPPNAACAWDFIKFLHRAAAAARHRDVAGWLPARADLDLTAVPRGQPGLRGLPQEAGRHRPSTAHAADRRVRRDRDQARHPSRGRLRRLREPAGSSRQDPGAARHLGRRDQRRS